MSYTDAQLRSMAIAAADANGVPSTFFTQLIQDESGFNPQAQNPSSSAGGIAQFIDSTANNLHIDKFDPAQALPAAAKYLKQLYGQTGSWLGAANAYGTTAGAGAPNVGNLSDALSIDGILGNVGGDILNQLIPGSGAILQGQDAAGPYSNAPGILQLLKEIFSIGTAQRATAVVIGGLLVLIAIAILIAENKTVQNVVTRVGKVAALA